MEDNGGTEPSATEVSNYISDRIKVRCAAMGGFDRQLHTTRETEIPRPRARACAAASRGWFVQSFAPALHFAYYTCHYMYTHGVGQGDVDMAGCPLYQHMVTAFMGMSDLLGARAAVRGGVKKDYDMFQRTTRHLITSGNAPRYARIAMYEQWFWASMSEQDKAIFEAFFFNKPSKADSTKGIETDTSEPRCRT